jgi:hypothetical protein
MQMAEARDQRVLSCLEAARHTPASLRIGTARAGTDGLKNLKPEFRGPPKPLRAPLRSSKARSQSTNLPLADGDLQVRRMSQSQTFAAPAPSSYGWVLVFEASEIRRRSKNVGFKNLLWADSRDGVWEPGSSGSLFCKQAWGCSAIGHSSQHTLPASAGQCRVSSTFIIFP